MRNLQNPYGGADGAAPAAGVAFASSNNTHNLLSNFGVGLLRKAPQRHNVSELWVHVEGTDF